MTPRSFSLALLIIGGLGAVSFGAQRLMTADPMNALVQPNWRRIEGGTGPTPGGALITHRGFSTADDASFVFAQLDSKLKGWSKHVLDDPEYYGYYLLHRRSGDFKIVVRHGVDNTEIQEVRPANAYERLQMRLPI